MLAEIDRISDVIDRVVPDALEFLALVQGFKGMIAEEDINAVLLVASGFIDFAVDGFHELDEGKGIAKRTAAGAICQFRTQ